MRYYCAAPAEHLAQPALVSTLFPQLPRALRPAFRLTFAALVILLVAVVSARWQVAGIAIAVFGFPVLLADYLYSARLLRNQPRWPWVTAIAVGVIIGAGWAVITGVQVAATYGIGVGAGIAGGPNAASLGVPLGAVLMMMAPAAIVRLLLRRSRDPLQGFTIGVLGATAVGLSATLVRLWPQLASGLVSRERPLDSLLVEAGIRGIVIPLTSAAFGGIAGLALWFNRRTTGGSRRRPVLVILILAVVTVAGGGGLAEAADLGPIPQLLVHLALTVAVLAVLRVAIHLTLLHHRGGGPGGDHTVECPECGHEIVPARFCPACGVALSGVAHPVQSEGSAARRTVTVPVAGLAAAVAIMSAISALVTEPVARYVCPPECGNPPTGEALHTNPRFTAADGAFSVDHPAPESGYDVVTGATGVTVVQSTGDGGTLRLFGEPARGRSARQVVGDLLARDRPSVVRAFEIPNAMVGYQPGYGEVDDDYPVSATGAYVRLRVVAIAAVKDDYALVATAVGPFHQFGPDFGPGPPSAVNLQLALVMDRYVNSFVWGQP